MDRRGTLGPEAGTTLVELLVTVAILGLAIVAIVGGMSTSIVATDYGRKQAQARTVLVSAAEAVKSNAGNPYQSCATPASYAPASGVTLPTGWTAAAVAVLSVKYWDGAAWATACPSPDSKLQLLDVQVTAPGGRAIETATVVKRNPS